MEKLTKFDNELHLCYKRKRTTGKIEVPFNKISKTIEIYLKGENQQLGLIQ